MTIVVKIGGAAGNQVDPVLPDLTDRAGTVLVHGGSSEIDRLGIALGRPSEYYTSPSGVVSRRSDAAHLEVVVLALAGKIQTDLAARCAAQGIRAVGLSGVDGALIRARRKEGARAVVDGRILRVPDDRSGTIERVDADLLRLLLGAGILPILGPPAVTAEGEIVNVDADRLAAHVAIALAAERLVFLTNVAGLLRAPDDPGSLIPRVRRTDLASVLPYALGRMRKKLAATQTALEGGVREVIIASSAGPQPIERAIRGEGTVFA